MSASCAAIWFIGISAAWFAPSGPGVVRVQYQIEEKPPVTVGRIIIVGNTVTQDDVIRRALGLYPGQVLRFPELRIAEANLTRLGIFEADPQKGSRPTVTAIPTEDPNVQDILVQVKETLTGTFTIGVGYNTRGRIKLFLRIEERNFDPWRLPTCFEDFDEGRAFRGAGRRLRVNLTLGGR